MKILTRLLLLFTMNLLINAQVDLIIENNTTIETTGNTYIEISGDLIENGSGYLKGTVSSGNRGNFNVSSFAGLTLSTSGVNQIKRITGQELSTAPSKTYLRSYELFNSSTLFTTNLKSEYVSSVTYNEKNGITTPFIYRQVGSNWSGYNNSSTTPNSTVAAKNVVVASRGTTKITIAEGIGVAAKIFLEGSYQSGGTMSSIINSNIPNISPYSEDPRTVSSIPANAVDWVLVSLRKITNPYSVFASHSAFVDIKGRIIDDLGNPNTAVPANQTGSYRISVKHRNHLEVMSNSDLILDWESN